MEDWVIEYLKKEDGIPLSQLSKEYRDRIIEVNFDCIGKNEDTRTTFISISETLIQDLTCRIDVGIIKTEEKINYVDNFKIRFASVLARLEEANLKKLNSKKDVVYVYAPIPAYIRNFEPDKFRAVIFAQDLGFPSTPCPVCRGLIIHELIHIIENLGSNYEEERQVHEIAEKWGFKSETEKARSYQWEKC